MRYVIYEVNVGSCKSESVASGVMALKVLQWLI